MASNDTVSVWNDPDPIGQNETGYTMEEAEYFYIGASTINRFHLFYRDIHGYFALIVCIFGIIANLLNIVVLTRKTMISATNCILTGLAVSDGLTMAAYVPFALRFYIFYGTDPTPERNSLPAMHFLLFYACFSVVVHTVSIWLTVTLAIFRYIFIRFPRKGAAVCSLARAKLAVLLVYLVTILVCIPNFVTITVTGHGSNVSNSSTIYIVSFKTETQAEMFIHDFNFWIQAIIVKLVPCIGLTILSILLVRTMQAADKRSRTFRQQATTNNNESNREKKTNRTTRMLLVVVLLFLLTEFPQGILNLLSGMMDKFVQEIYSPLGDLMDILALLNNGINFILYCTMSKQFRDTFFETFRCTRFTRDKSFSLVPTASNALTTKTQL